MSYASSVLRLARIPVLVACLGLLLAGCGVNNIPSYDEAAKAKWSDVLNQYQRRADLIPNLVATVQGYAKQEKDVLTAVVVALRPRAPKVIEFTVMLRRSTEALEPEPMCSTEEPPPDTPKEPAAPSSRVMPL